MEPDYCQRCLPRADLAPNYEGSSIAAVPVMTWKACLVLLAFAALSQAQNLDELARDSLDPDQVNYEWEGYDGWYNNPAHPEWGGAGEWRRRAVQPFIC